MNRKLIVVDLDNTLLQSNKKLSEYTKNCLRLYESLGHLVVITSSDSYDVINKYHEEIGLKSPIISSGGGELHFYSHELDDIVMGIDVDTLKNLFKETENEILSAFYHYQNHLFLHKKMDLMIPLYQIKDSTIIHENDYTKIDLISPNMIFLVVDVHKLDKFMSSFEKYSDYLELTTIGKDLEHALYYLNIKNVNKMYAVLELMLRLKINLDDVIIVGDSLRDREMLSLEAETVCMINGEKEAKEAAKYISEFDNDNDGCVKAINKILGI